MKLRILYIACVAILTGCQSSTEQNHTLKEMVPHTKTVSSKVSPLNEVKPELQPEPELFTNKLFYEIVSNEPKGDEFSSSSEVQSLLSEYLKRYDGKKYIIDVELSNYFPEEGYFYIGKSIDWKKLNQSTYIATNSLGVKVKVSKLRLKSDVVAFSKPHLYVSSNVARNMNGKVGRLIVSNIKPTESFDGRLCGVSGYAPSLDAPYDNRTMGCEIEFESSTIIIDGKEYQLR
ncbi:hypothetical protein ACEUA9_04245 [Aeromonas caviae]|uniref:hypothetical protein n=1 Tax=Aeromonas TaxID=642 RepID=UPI0038CFFE8F